MSARRSLAAIGLGAAIGALVGAAAAALAGGNGVFLLALPGLVTMVAACVLFLFPGTRRLAGAIGAAVAAAWGAWWLLHRLFPTSEIL